jgi:hypothetical protein
MEEITAVPRSPHPIIPNRMAELARVPKTKLGFKIVTAESTPALLRKDLRSIIAMTSCISF